MGKIRKFETGATRDTDQGKYDYEGFLSPVVLDRFSPRSAGYRPAALLLSYGGNEKLAEHQRLALWTPLRAQRFSGPFPRLCRTCSVEMVPTPGFAPGTTAVRSGVCIFYYTLRA